MPELNMCDKIQLLADEYFHGELSPEDKIILEEHIKSCEKCAEFFENEKIYFESIKSAEFALEKNIAESVMNIIISEQRAVDKPAKKRFVPFGLISAAAIVLVMFIASRGNLNLFMNTANDINDSAGSINGISEGFEEKSMENADGDSSFSAYYYAGDYEAENGEEAEVIAIPQIRAAMIEETGEAQAEAAENIAPVAEAPAPAAAAPAPMIEALLDSMDSSIEEATGAATALIPAPSEIIKIRRGEAEIFDFAEYIFIGESIFISKEYKDALLEDLKTRGIYFEIENTGIDSDESEHIEIVYID